MTFLKLLQDTESIYPLGDGGMSIFGRGSGGLCLYVNEEGFCQDIA